MQLRLNLYRGRRINYLSNNAKQEKETSYTYGVARVTAVPLQLDFKTHLRRF